MQNSAHKGAHPFLTCHTTQMEISADLHRYADLEPSIPRKQQSIIKSFAKALEIIPRQLCDNAGFDATNILTQLRVEHRKGNIWTGVDFDNEGVRDNMAAFVWEPSLVKVNAIQAAVEAGCLVMSVDETISESFFLMQCSLPPPFFFSFSGVPFCLKRLFFSLSSPKTPPFCSFCSFFFSGAKKGRGNG